KNTSTPRSPHGTRSHSGAGCPKMTPKRVVKWNAITDTAASPRRMSSPGRRSRGRGESSMTQSIRGEARTTRRKTSANDGGRLAAQEWLGNARFRRRRRFYRQLCPDGQQALIRGESAAHSVGAAAAPDGTERAEEARALAGDRRV